MIMANEARCRIATTRNEPMMNSRNQTILLGSCRCLLLFGPKQCNLENVSLLEVSRAASEI